MLKWNDNSVVSLLSNALGEFPLVKVQRWSKKEKKFIQTERPHAIKVYNKVMGGVDQLDSGVATYRTKIKAKSDGCPASPTTHIIFSLCLQIKSFKWQEQIILMYSFKINNRFKSKFCNRT